jgi:raffinose/stachyose/melibiose transport system substrate-binding protein
MTRIKRTMAGAAFVAVLAMGLAGCTAANPTPPTDNGAVTWNKPTAKLDGVTLTLWTQPATSTYADQVIGAFEKATGAKIDKVVLPDDASQLTKIATGDLPDVAWWQPTGSAMSVLLPSKNLQPLDSAPWLSKLDPAVAAIGVVNKIHYAAMVSTPSVLGMFYNKADFAKAGITKDPTDWDSLIETAKTLKAAGITPFYEGGGDGWPTQWWPQVQLAEAAKAGFWDQVNVNKESFTSQPMQDVITRYKGMIDDGLFNSDILTATFDDQGTHLLDGSAAMVLQDSSAFLGLANGKLAGASIDDKLGWFPISTKGTIATTIPTGANALVAFNTGDKKKEAATRQFLSFWLGPDYAKYIADLKTASIEPAVPNPSGLPSINGKIKDSLSNSIGSMQSLAAVNPDLWRNLQDMLNGGKTPQQVGEATNAQFSDLAKAQGLPGF